MRGHKGESGNEAVRAAAEEATLHRSLTSARTLDGDVHEQHPHALFLACQDEWIRTQNNKLQVL